HEAIGHVVEADFVLSGSIARDLLGKKIASELVTLVDSGTSNIVPNAAGTTLVDDEGVMARSVRIIDEGILSSYLHNRESAYLFGVEPTGNARAFEYDDEPLIRMRNTYVEPRDYSLDEMIKEVNHGYMLKGARNGQADANGEFMFGAEEAYLIEHGEVKELFKGVSISGITMDVLKSVDAVSSSKDFRYDIGTGYCGKYQPMKVDGGGSYIRCTAIVGGVQ
ncbi:MAG: TldD/PmbA family protein, partial [Candidatus Nitrosocaldus sp.]